MVLYQAEASFSVLFLLILMIAYKTTCIILCTSVIFVYSYVLEASAHFTNILTHQVIKKKVTGFEHPANLKGHIRVK